MTNRLWAVVALCAGFAGVGAVPAVAADPLLFSLDGQAWDSELAGPLFGETVTLVPGDEVSMTFWVRNASNDPADLRVALMSEWPTAGDADLWVHAALDGAAAPGNGEPMLLTVDGMDARGSRKVTVTVGLDTAAGNTTQNINRTIAFDVRLTQSIPVEGPEVDRPVSPRPDPSSEVPAAPDNSGKQPQARPGGSSGTLSSTGFTALWLVVTGAALTAGGFLAVAYSRKKKNTSEEGSHGSA